MIVEAPHSRCGNFYAQDSFLVWRSACNTASGSNNSYFGQEYHSEYVQHKCGDLYNIEYNVECNVRMSFDIRVYGPFKNVKSPVNKWGFQNVSLTHLQNYYMYGLQLLFIITN